jgi:hypothetical protein
MRQSTKRGGAEGDGDTSAERNTVDGGVSTSSEADELSESKAAAKNGFGEGDDDRGRLSDEPKTSCGSVREKKERERKNNEKNYFSCCICVSCDRCPLDRTTRTRGATVDVLSRSSQFADELI